MTRRYQTVSFGKRLAMGASILVVAVIAILLWVHQRPVYVIAVVTRDQQHTASLNPTRLQVANQRAWTDMGERGTLPSNLTLEYFRYTQTNAEVFPGLERLHAKRRLVAVIGDISSAETADLAAFAAEQGIPHVSPVASEEEAVVHSPWSFSVRLRLSHESETIAHFIEQELAASGVAILYANSAGYPLRLQSFLEVASELSLPVHLVEEVPDDTEMFGDILDTIAALPDETAIVVLLTTRMSEHFLQQAHLVDLPNPRVLSSAIPGPGFADFLGAAAQGVYGVVPCFALGENELVNEFLGSYSQALGTGRVDNVGVFIYDALSVLLSVVTDVGFFPENVRDALATYQGQHFIGSIAFDASGLLWRSEYTVLEF